MRWPVSGVPAGRALVPAAPTAISALTGVVAVIHIGWGVSLPGLVGGICCLVALACVASAGVGSTMPVLVGLHLASSESWEPGKEKIRTLPWSEVAL